MTPLDPATPAEPDPKSPTAPPYVDENPNLASVELGMDLAEEEVRELAGDSSEASVGEVSLTPPITEAHSAVDDDRAPELDAMHSSRPPAEDR